MPAIPTAAAEQNHRSYTVRTRHGGGRRTLTGYQATLPKDNGALRQVHKLCNTGKKSHNLVFEDKVVKKFAIFCNFKDWSKLLGLIKTAQLYIFESGLTLKHVFICSSLERGKLLGVV